MASRQTRWKSSTSWTSTIRWLTVCGLLGALATRYMGTSPSSSRFARLATRSLSSPPDPGLIGRRLNTGWWNTRCLSMRSSVGSQRPSVTFVTRPLMRIVHHGSERGLPSMERRHDGHSGSDRGGPPTCPICHQAPLVTYLHLKAYSHPCIKVQRTVFWNSKGEFGVGDHGFQQVLRGACPR